MKIFASIFLLLFLSSCWKWRVEPRPDPGLTGFNKVWGNKPIYSADAIAKKIGYINQPQPVSKPR